MSKDKRRRYSSPVVDGIGKSASRAMLRAVGFTDEDFRKPQVGIASTWSNLTPCNMHINRLAEESAAGADAAGGKSLIFNTITVSDGIANGTEGMKYSLVSREVIADSIETVAGCEGFDALVAIGGCDKNMPGCMMGLARLNRPAIFVYGGTILPGENHTDIISVFEAVGAHAQGKLDLIEVKQIEETAIPGAGSCGGMYTANTMASAIIQIPYSNPHAHNTKNFWVRMPGKFPVEIPMKQSLKFWEANFLTCLLNVWSKKCAQELQTIYMPGRRCC